MTPDKPVLFFDGVCGLCNGFVDFVFRRDREHQFLFAPLQGATAKALLPAQLVVDLNTVVLWENGNVKLKAEAAVEVLKRLGGLSGLLSQAAQFVPPILQVKAYDMVAENRYKIFGQLEACRLPTVAEKPYFLP